MLGLHLLLDGLAKDACALDDPASHEEALLLLPLHLGLTPVAEPQVVVTTDGWVGMVLLAESHFSLHVRPRARMLHADLFSCRAFDVGRAQVWLTERFGLIQVSARAIER